MNLGLAPLFQFGLPALYYDSCGKVISCQVFLDTGWKDEAVGYDSHAAEMVTFISVLLETIPIPRRDDQIELNNTLYTVTSVHAEDEVIAVLQVKKDV